MHLFIDTSAIVAMAVRQEGRHENATRTYSKLRTQGHGMVVSDYVFDETLTRIKKVAGPHQAVTVGGMLQSTEIADLHRVDAEDFANAWRLFQKYVDQGLSFTDCTIVAQMDRLDIDTIFTFDKGFKKVGKRVVP